MNILKATIIVVLAALVGSALSGCSRSAMVESGEYIVADAYGEADEANIRAVTLEINRDERLAAFTLADGSEIVTSFMPRAGKWPSGCPSNIGVTNMEVFDIEEAMLTLDSVTFNKPILVRDCPPEPNQVVLREDGEIGGAGTACNWPDTCIFFAPKPD